jgi:hypothetical protein
VLGVIYSIIYARACSTLDAAFEGLGDEWWALLWWEFVWLVWLTVPEYSSQTSGQEIASKVTRGTMVGENRRLVHYQPMDFLSWPVQISNHRMAIRL